MKKILVVDDETAITRLIKLNLEATGNYAVFTENHGSRAIPAAREHLPDVLLLDIMMPDMLGSEVAEMMREDPELKHVKIVFLTAMLKKGEEDLPAAHQETQRILAKPVSTQDLIAAIEVVLGSSAASAEQMA